jgi:hypothetical protein
MEFSQWRLYVEEFAGLKNDTDVSDTFQIIGIGQCSCVYLAISYGTGRLSAPVSSNDALAYKKVSCAFLLRLLLAEQCQ